MLRSWEPTLEVHPPRGGRALLYVGNISGIQKYSSLLADANKIRSQNGFALCEGCWPSLHRGWVRLTVQC